MIVVGPCTFTGLVIAALSVYNMKIIKYPWKMYALTTVTRILTKHRERDRPTDEESKETWRDKKTERRTETCHQRNKGHQLNTATICCYLLHLFFTPCSLFLTLFPSIMIYPDWHNTSHVISLFPNVSLSINIKQRSCAKYCLPDKIMVWQVLKVTLNGQPHNCIDEFHHYIITAHSERNHTLTF